MGLTEEQVKSVFDKFDRDGNGTIVGKELLTVLMDLGKSEEDAKAQAGFLLAEADADGDKKITWDEFKAAVLK